MNVQMHWHLLSTHLRRDNKENKLYHVACVPAVLPFLNIQIPLELVPSTYRDEQNQADYAILSATEQQVSGPEQAADSIVWLFPVLTGLALFLHREVFAEDMDTTHRFMELFWPQCCAHGSAVLGQLSGDPQALQTCVEV